MGVGDMQRCVEHSWEPAELVVTEADLDILHHCRNCPALAFEPSHHATRDRVPLGPAGGVAGTQESRHPSVDRLRAQSLIGQSPRFHAS